MAVRRRTVLPDEVLSTERFGQIPVVSDPGFIDAVVGAAQTQALAGGVLTILVDRHPTDLEGEMVTTMAVIEWKDRTDAKPQPEPTTGMRAEPTAGPALTQGDPASMERVREALGKSEAGGSDPGIEEAAAAHADEPDGFDRSKLEEEDVDSVPEHAR
jgi:hypothetical protein